ncbi:hypothetical protein ZOD2009_00030 [Haladaptatus paucihalophilus DX253]|uniref:Uncharacterized protein n=1 Tax=Haladaptatus paucihalophilus DX253 TaxID=797209 RepID=E7QMJ0_HALPU|nr:hypothetical protein ZOD2009_00030 [Haladaptatus paucihalophilus DX253]
MPLRSVFQISLQLGFKLVFGDFSPHVARMHLVTSAEKLAAALVRILIRILMRSTDCNV